MRRPKQRPSSSPKPAAQRAPTCSLCGRTSVWGPGDGQLTKRIIDRARSGRLPILGTGAPLVDTLFIDNAVDAFVAGLRRLPTIAAEQPLASRRLVVTNGEPGRSES